MTAFVRKGSKLKPREFIYVPTLWSVCRTSLTASARGTSVQLIVISLLNASGRVALAQQTLIGGQRN